MKLARSISDLLLPLFVLLSPLNCCESKNEAKINDEIPVEIERLSERVLILSDVPPNGNVTAISTSKGIIVIDTGVSWSFGYGFRRIIEREFKRTDFAYVINTHADRDHTFGNQAFEDVTIIGHENCLKALHEMKKTWDVKKNEYVSLHKERAERRLRELKAMVADSDQADIKRRQVATNELIASNLTEGQEIILPKITFRDRITLRSGDIVLHLYHLGEGHSNCDILIHVPQERLVVAGDAFIRTMLICYMKQDKFDVERYYEILNAVLNGGTPVRYVTCGHGSPMSGKELLARRDYLGSLLESIRQGYAEGLDLETASRRLPLDGYSNLTRLIGRTPAELESEHSGLIEKFWSMLQSSNSSE